MLDFHRNAVLLNLDHVRDEFPLLDLDDDILVAFAENWISPADVPWHDLEDSFRGLVTADSEDEAIGNYLWDLYEECGDIPDGPLSHYIDWEKFGRDARLGGEFRAVRLPNRHATDDWQRALASRDVWAIFAEY